MRLIDLSRLYLKVVAAVFAAEIWEEEDAAATAVDAAEIAVDGVVTAEVTATAADGAVTVVDAAETVVDVVATAEVTAAAGATMADTEAVATVVRALPKILTKTNGKILSMMMIGNVHTTIYDPDTSGSFL